jgi:Leucine-rich repeat (LRR) protein
LKSLEYLTLSVNKLRVIPDTLRNLTNLEEIWITVNPLVEYPYALNELPNLKYIKIGTTLNQRFEGEFKELREKGVQEY